MEMIRNISNIYFCILFPMIVAGLICLGYYELSAYQNKFVIFLGAGIGYLIGYLIRGIFKWE